jgi:hypothetical protein
MKTVKTKQRKMMLMLPVLVIPFLTMGFWALGGGKGKKQEDITKGLNLELPDANLKDDKGLDKLSFYDQAEKDSLKLEEWMRTDPYWKKDTVPEFLMPNELQTITTESKYGQRLNTSLYENKSSSAEEQLMQKLKALQDQLNKPAETVAVAEEEETYEPTYTTPQEDPDIKQLNGALEKILDIQHPDRVKERSVKNKGAVYSVRRESGPDTLVKGFFSYSDEKELVKEEENAIEAFIAANQTIVNGAVVKFRTLTEIFVTGKKIAANTLISGIATLDGERLVVEINSIRSGKSLYNVSWKSMTWMDYPAFISPAPSTVM